MLVLLLAGLVVAVAPRPMAGAQGGSPPPEPDFVGSWLLTITLPGEPPDPHLATFGADGTFVETARPVQAAPADVPFRAIFPSPGHGGWEATGERAVVLVFTRLLADENGTYLGTVPAVATLERSADGLTATGSVTFETVDPAGTVIGSGSGTIRGERIGVGSPAPSSVGTPAATPGA
jgi:hypothetical protein